MVAETYNTTMLELFSDPDNEEGIHFTEVYRRPMYVIHNMTFFTNNDFFEVNDNNADTQDLMKNYTFVLQCTGRRWCSQCTLDIMKCIPLFAHTNSFSCDVLTYLYH